MDWSGPEREAAKAIALLIVALLLPLVTTLWLRDTWRWLQGALPADADTP
jgi:hypothetical protein